MEGGGTRLRDILNSLGEVVAPGKVLSLVRGVTNDQFHISTFPQFIRIIDYIKRNNNRSILKSGNTKFGPGVAPLTARPKISRRLEYDLVMERYFFRDTVTDRVSWDVPEAVRLYLPPAMEEKVTRPFSAPLCCPLHTGRQEMSYLPVAADIII
eukprot:gene1573-biopygen1696